MDLEGIKVFSATKHRDRASLGDDATRWMTEQRDKDKTFKIVGKVVTQSSDAEFHCISITLFYKRDQVSKRGVRK